MDIQELFAELVASKPPLIWFQLTGMEAVVGVVTAVSGKADDDVYTVKTVTPDNRVTTIVFSSEYLVAYHLPRLDTVHPQDLRLLGIDRVKAQAPYETKKG
jgi:hypothetical protein